MPQARQAFSLEFALALPEAVFLQHDGRRIDHHHTQITVDDDPVVLTNDATGFAGAHDGRDIQAARNDGGVRGLAAQIRHEAAEHAFLEAEHVGGRDIAGHQNQRLLATEVLLVGMPAIGFIQGSPARQHAQEALDHLFDIGLALAQIGIVHFVELARQHFELC